MIPPLEVWHSHHIARAHAPAPWSELFRALSAFSRRLVRSR